MRFYNVTPHPMVVGGWHNPAVFPGQGWDFPEGYDPGEGWARKNPREGLEQERAFKARRRAEAARQAETVTTGD